MAYINERYIPKDKTTKTEDEQNKWRAQLLALKKGPTDLAPYQQRNQLITQGGTEATNYETQKRQKRQQAYIDALKNKLEQQVRSVSVGTGDNGSPIGRNYNPGNGGISDGVYRGGNPTDSFLPVKGNSFNAFMSAISGQESGGNYNARNSGSGAMGRFQVMPGNISGPGGWDKEALGYDISTSQFQNNPKLQDQIARYKLRQYYNQFGPRGAAIAWYAGPGAVRYSSASLNRSQRGGPSINDYARSVLKRMGL
jgi:hypothetical protein